MKEAKGCRLRPNKLIIELAYEYGYRQLKKQPNPLMVSFVRGSKQKGTWQKVDVYFTTMTVATSLNHPYKGKTQLYRRNVTMPELQQIFNNPRVHTNKGYRSRK